jgi:hypothetical protein
MACGLLIVQHLTTLPKTAGLHEELKAADHDFSGLSITPSVKLIMDPPSGERATQPSEWYAGSVHLTLKDATLQASTPLRHAAELLEALRTAGKLKEGPCKIEVSNISVHQRKPALYES